MHSNAAAGLDETWVCNLASTQDHWALLCIYNIYEIQVSYTYQMSVRQYVVIILTSMYLSRQIWFTSSCLVGRYTDVYTTSAWKRARFSWWDNGIQLEKWHCNITNTHVHAEIAHFPMRFVTGAWEAWGRKSRAISSAISHGHGFLLLSHDL